ncbi:Uncharacterized protein APZ42_014790 [Daphnia magna]|uniref:Uncharacterized protein n=1 Tax=Daphnia magna TaxID=35525 RepID=A0A162PKU8_9CRUS|nr:Uncharacterized protein APZ42_014790 [Daphnia magna]
MFSKVHVLTQKFFFLLHPKLSKLFFIYNNLLSKSLTSVEPNASMTVGVDDFSP